jgi:ATP-dependent DNA helicase RecG
MQTIMNIIDLLKKPEGKTLEFKRDLSSPSGVIRTMVAFANTAGGTIIIGVEDKKRYVCGVQDPLALEEKLANLTNDHIVPQLLPEIEVVPWRNTYLLVIQVFPSSVKPHYLKKKGLEKGTYIRVGSSNRLVDKTILTELKRVKLEDSFDKQAMVDLHSEAIDFRAASELFSPPRKLSESDLVSLDLVTTYQRKKVPTAGCILLFGKERLKIFPDAWIQVGRFAGITKTHIIDTQEITVYPILAIDEVIAFVKKHAMRGIEIKGTRHTETWSLPLTAIREAVINAIVHADYAQLGSPIRLAIFDDRIEIENPGLLLFGLTIDEIKRGVSKLRNRVIGQVFYRLGLIERWGSGIRRIIESCLEAGFPEPIFEEIGTHFRVTLLTQAIKEPSIDAVDQTILEALKNSDGLSTKEVAEAIKKSQRATRTRLVKLIEKGLVIEIGVGMNDPGRKYFLKN